MSTTYLLAGQASELEDDLFASELHLLRESGIEGSVSAEVVPLPLGHPYLRLPLQFATAFQDRLLGLVTADELAMLHEQGEAERAESGRWGTTFTLLRCWGRSPA